MDTRDALGLLRDAAELIRREPLDGPAAMGVVVRGVRNRLAAVSGGYELKDRASIEALRAVDEVLDTMYFGPRAVLANRSAQQAARYAIEEAIQKVERRPRESAIRVCEPAVQGVLL